MHKKKILASLACRQETCALNSQRFRIFVEFVTLQSEKGGWVLWQS